MCFWIYQVWLGVCIQTTPLFHHQWLNFTAYWDTDGLQFPLAFAGRGLQWALAPHDCIIFKIIFMPGGDFVSWLGGRNLRVCFHPQWWILPFFKRYLVWVCGCYLFSLKYCLMCRGYWYGDWLWLHPWRCLGPILILFRYFGLCFSCLKVGFWCDLALEYFCKFSKCIKFLCV